MWYDRQGKEIKPGDYIAYAVGTGRGSGWLEIGVVLRYYDSGKLGVMGMSDAANSPSLYNRPSYINFSGSQLVLVPEQLPAMLRQLLDDYYKDYLEKHK